MRALLERLFRTKMAKPTRRRTFVLSFPALASQATIPLPKLQGVRLQTEKVPELMYQCVEMDHLLSASTIPTSSQGGASQPTIASI